MKEADFAAFLDGFNRLAKLDLDLGEASDPEAAMARLKGYAAHIRVGAEVAGSTAHQIAVLTLVNILSRFALGGVTLSGMLDAPMLAPWPSRTLMAAVETLGGAAGEPAGDCPTAVVGTADDVVDRAIQLTFEGWRGGIVPAGASRLDEAKGTAVSAVLAAAIGAAEIFAILREEVASGRRPRGLSIWRPDGDQDWLSPASDGPPLLFLPNRLWILGLGHLGQAFLWSLAMCPFADRAEVSLVLQDMDDITKSTASTSILTMKAARGRKTRDVARTLEAMGFSTVIIERPFDDQFKRRPEDPLVLICGVDNAHARSQLEAPGFPLIVEAGIGRSTQDFQAIRLHTFPSRRKAAELWRTEMTDATAVVAETRGYQRLRERGVDECGLARLAGTAVGAPFVGTVAGVLMLGQILRLLHGDQVDAVIDLDLRALDARRVVPNANPLALNPGFQICDV
ncbi:hypothetical protein [Microbaculum sp. FT89]|uniref:hypothetical protein n=1 Tax=Microbaculum sp. FT89 TaxID=3447298 RepID=UPI003F53D343